MKNFWMLALVLVAFTACGDGAKGDLPDWLYVLVTGLGVVGSTVFGWIMKLITKYLKVKTKNARWVFIFSALSDAALRVVSDLNQRVVNDLKEARKDGKITEEEMAKIKQDALDAVKDYLKHDVWADLADVLGGEDRAVKAASEAIEAAVLAHKK